MKLVIGLTGEIGAGKSTVAKRLAELGAKVIDADKIGHQVLADPQVVPLLANAFGDDILDADGQVDRRKLGGMVFAAEELRAKLEQIVHPPMVEQFRRQIASAQDDEQVAAVVLDAAILLEAHWDELCHRILVVAAPREVRLERLMQSRQWTEHDLTVREQAQAPLEWKRRRADAVVENAGSLPALWKQVDDLFRTWVEEFARLSVSLVSLQSRN